APVDAGTVVAQTFRPTRIGEGSDRLDAGVVSLLARYSQAALGCNRRVGDAGRCRHRRSIRRAVVVHEDRDGVIAVLGVLVAARLPAFAGPVFGALVVFAAVGAGVVATGVVPTSLSEEGRDLLDGGRVFHWAGYGAAALGRDCGIGDAGCRRHRRGIGRA